MTAIGKTRPRASRRGSLFPQRRAVGGYSALTTYALLASGESPTDSRAGQGDDFLKQADIVGTYAIGMRAQVWNLLPPPVAKDVHEAAARDAMLLMKAARTDKGGPGLLPLHRRRRPRIRDMTTDQPVRRAGALGLRPGGIDVAPHFWVEGGAGVAAR